MSMVEKCAYCSKPVVISSPTEESILITGVNYAVFCSELCRSVWYLVHGHRYAKAVDVVQ